MLSKHELPRLPQNAEFQADFTQLPAYSILLLSFNHDRSSVTASSHNAFAATGGFAACSSWLRVAGRSTAARGIELFALWKLQRVTKNGAHGAKIRRCGPASTSYFLTLVDLLWTRRKHTPLKRSRIESVPLLKVIVNVVGVCSEAALHDSSKNLAELFATALSMSI